ncbi:MAG: sulfotransferase [Gammaproteobacteria bacterium]|nr:sulfotransferase [Gammaproteobacteria bacterium]
MHQAARTALARGDLAQAQDSALRLLAADRGDAGAHFILGLVAAASGRFANALEFIDEAIRLDGRHAEYHAHRGRCLVALRRVGEAAAAAGHALALEPGDALTLDTLGVVFSHANDHARAARAFAGAVRLAPRHPGYQFNLGASLKFIGDFTGAERAFEAAIALSPRFWKAYSSRSELRRQTPEHNHVAALESLLANAAPDADGELHLRHALAREYEDLGDSARAFAHLAAGKARKRRAMAYDSGRDQALFDAVRAAFPAARLAVPAAAAADAAPIFVVGMPRTGTTLVERILSSHPSVVSVGESQNLPLALRRAAGGSAREVLDPGTLARCQDLDFAAIGREYLAATAPPGAMRFVDKMPLNFLYVGVIRLALPSARVVCLRRHPLDTCLGNYRQLFSLGVTYYDYAYDLADTARYYLLFDRLMAHWRMAAPGFVHELSYEGLVADQQGETRRLLEFCGLPWDEACLHFQENAAPVATASAVQVREALNSRSVGRWRRYQAELAPARAVLEAAGIDLSPAWPPAAVPAAAAR